MGYYMAAASLEKGFNTSPVPKSFTHGPRVACPFPTIVAAFNYHASSNPNLIAARDLTGSSPREINYEQLARKARILSRRLVEAGVRPGDRVPLVVKRGIDMLIGILAILSSGASYVPLDGGVVPDSTIQLVLEQAGSDFALCLRSTERRLRNLNRPCTLIVIDENSDSTELNGNLGSLPDLATPESGCYVIYTSGTTGKPKGVDVTHKNVTNLVCLAPGNLGIQPGVKVGSLLNISFDMAAWEVLGSLSNGGTLIMRGSKWEDALQQINVMIATPSILAKYDPVDYPNIKVTATAGEPSSQKLADTWATHGEYWNNCGPTETTIVNTMAKHVPGSPLTIGRPIPNNIVYLLDEDGKQVAVGEPGTMWAGGDCVSRGYIGLPEKTAEKYKPDCFANDGSMMYNTGDICRWREDGLIEILGRQDDQIKIKGFRVELDGVSASINSYSTVTRACALFINNEIHGFLAPADVDIEGLKEHMKKKQPYYAIPTRFHCLHALPATQNGKIDKRTLKTSVESLIVADDQKSFASNSNILLPPRSDTSSVPSTTGSSNVSLVEEKKIVEIEEMPLDAALPGKNLSKPWRGFVHRIFIIYRRLFTLVGILNLAALVSIFAVGVSREWLSTLVAINLVLAVLIRQDFVINFLYTITCSVPKSWPFAIRKRCAKIFHLGGVHSGAAVSSGLWLLVFNISNAVCGLSNRAVCPGYTPQSTASLVISWMLSALFVVMFVMAWPSIRKVRHDLFERVHRFVGWTMLALFWVQVVLGAEDFRRANMPVGTTLGDAVVVTPGFWLLVIATISIAMSWLFLRKVNVDAEVLSDHAVRLHFDYTVPVNGSFTRLSTRPLFEWHSFATIPAPKAVNGHPAGYSLVVSNAGDWTKHLIQNPPRSLWIRSVPTCGVMRIATCFNSIVCVATGSGIGPCLGHLQNPTCETGLIWSTPRPEKTFGKPIIDAIKAKTPDAVIHDTKVLGRPDLVKMTYNMVKHKNAEAVIIIANEKITKKVVYGLETRGIAAYGAIWDS